MQGPLQPRRGCCGCQRPIRVCGLQPVFDALGYSWHANCVPSGWSRRVVETVDLTDGDSSAVSSWEAAVAASSEEAAVAASDGEVAAEARLQMGRSQPKPGFRWGGRSCGLLWRGRRCGRSRSHGRPRRGGRSRSSRRQLATSRCVLGHVAQAQPPLAQRQEPQSLSHAVEHQGRLLVTRSVVR